jgi:hypothetical protein
MLFVVILWQKYFFCKKAEEGVAAVAAGLVS